MRCWGFRTQCFRLFPLRILFRFFSVTAGIPQDDVALIALDGHLSLMRFLLHMPDVDQNKIPAYAGRNSDVVTWANYRRPRSRIAQYLRRFQNITETETPIDVPPLYISFGCSKFREDSSRFPIELSTQKVIDAGYPVAAIFPTFQRYVSERLRNRPLISPSDTSLRVQLIMEFVEIRLVRFLPH